VTLFRAVPIILRWIPHVVTAISLIEVLAADRPGSEKKAAAMKWLETTSKKAKLPWGDTAITVVGGLIDAGVGIANLLGAFRGPSEVSIPDDLDPENPIDRRAIEALKQME